MRKRLSVIIPGYRTPPDVWKRCIASVLRNIGRDDEIICVDDASPVYPAVLDALAAADSRICAIRLAENRGQAFARNAGLDRATGEYAAFVDSDDEILPGIYDEAIKAVERDSADISVYGVRTVWFNDALCRESVPHGGFLGVLTAQNLAQMRKDRLFNFPWNKIYRKSFLDAHALRFRERLVPREDEVFNLDCILAGAKWTMVPAIGHLYYHGDGTSLARYRRFNRECNEGVNAAWRDVSAHFGESASVLGTVEMPPRALLLSDWRNLWRRESPWSLKDKWRWLREHPEIGGFAFFCASLVFFFARNHLYFRPVRRMHIKRVAPGVRDLREGDMP